LHKSKIFERSFHWGVILKLSVSFAFDTALCLMCNCENDQEKLILQVMFECMQMQNLEIFMLTWKVHVLPEKTHAFEAAGALLQGIIVICISLKRSVKKKRFTIF
jgi:hypothetical protein